jgi:hypothetical protein
VLKSTIGVVINPQPVGHHQVARQARLHPPPHRRRDRGGQQRQRRLIKAPRDRRAARQEARVAGHAGYVERNTEDWLGGKRIRFC